MTSFEIAGHRTVAQLIQARQKELGITDQQISVALGYDQENVVVMIKRGAMRLPINKVIEMAGVLDIDAAMLLRLTLSETDPVMLQTIEKIVGPMTMTLEEKRHVQACCKLAAGRKVAPTVFMDSVVALVAV